MWCLCGPRTVTKSEAGFALLCIGFQLGFTLLHWPQSSIRVLSMVQHWIVQVPRFRADSYTPPLHERPVSHGHVHGRAPCKNNVWSLAESRGCSVESRLKFALVIMKASALLAAKEVISVCTANPWTDLQMQNTIGFVWKKSPSLQ